MGDDDDDDEQDDVSENDSVLDDEDDGPHGCRDTNMYKAPVRHPKHKTEKWQKGKSKIPKNKGGSSRNFDPYLKGTMATDGSASDMLSDLEEAMWISDDEGGQKNSTQPNAEDAPGTRASRGVGNSFRTCGRGQMKKNEDTRKSKRKVKSSKDMDETWDSD
ncbi:hypothetical protein K7X08_002791 [Anisodus acutangulus]|uniref:Uncharacterized protein n=1 Tax=Anisodus acutangulus TaxID=402998 RepID=A0A9Q1MFI4_9SOLA|nr:hypothetical protein K7X08_002791 [Anisodus acutangulus]